MGANEGQRITSFYRGQLEVFGKNEEPATLFFTCWESIAHIVLSVTAALALQVILLGRPHTSEARDLTDVFVQGFSYNAVGKNTAPAAAQFAPFFSAAVAQAVTQEFPYASVSPAFTYRYNPTLSVFERSTNVPGPLFSERSLTLGKGQWNLGVGYSFVDFDELNGTGLHSFTSPGLLLEVITDEDDLVQRPDGLFLAPIATSSLRTKIDLNAHIVVPTLRYGITDNWDVTISIPIVDTFLRVRNEFKRVAETNPTAASALVERNSQGGFQLRGVVDGQGQPIASAFSIPFVKSQRPTSTLARAAGSKTGVGDIALRTKYTFWQQESGGAALGLNLQLPSGDEDNFHGTGDTHLSSLVYVSQIFWERFEPHLNLGVDFNTGDVGRSSFLYAVGAGVLVWRQLGLVVDFLGRTEYSAPSFKVPQDATFPESFLTKPADQCTQAQPCFLDRTRGNNGVINAPFFPAKVKRNDYIDFSFGLRYVLGTRGSLFFAGLIPLNNDGFRSDFIPSGGIEYTF